MLENIIDKSFRFTPIREFYHKDTFTIVSVKPLDDDPELSQLLHKIYKTISIKGNMISMKRGSHYECDISNVEYDKKYGYSLEVTNVRPEGFKSRIDTDEDASEFILWFVGEGAYNSVKEVNGLCEMIKNGDKESLMEIKGIGKKTADKILTQYKDNMVNSSYIIELKKLHFTNKAISKIGNIYNGDYALALDIIKKNPFKLVEKGMRLDIIDNIFLNYMNGDKNNKHRIKCYIYKNFENEIYNSNKSFIEYSDFINLPIVQNISENIGYDKFNKYIDELVKEERLHLIDNKYITINSIYNTDVNLYKELIRLIGDNKVKVDFDIDKEIEYEEKRLHVQLNDGQKEAIRSIISSKVSLLLGSGGTGKTFTTQILLNILARNYEPFSPSLCALSGKASKILSEATLRSASTIHRLLCFRKGEFFYNKENPLYTDMLIADEASMIDNKIMLSLLEAMPTNCHILFLGDDNQLQSCGISNTIYDLRRIPNMNVVELTQIVRQAKKSAIKTMANDVRQDIVPFENVERKIYGELQDAEVIIGNNKYKDMINRFCDDFDVNNPLDYIVLGTTKKQVAKMNIDISKELRKRGKLRNSGNFIEIKTDAKDEKGKTIMQRIYEKDVILITKNCYHIMSVDDYNSNKEDGDLALFNGNCLVVDTILDDAIIVKDDNGESYVILDAFYDIIQFGLGLTVHKSQGSSINHCYMYFEDNYINRNMILTNELIYTAISRGRKDIVIYSESFNLLKKAIYNRDTNHRITIIDLIIRKLIKI